MQDHIVNLREKESEHRRAPENPEVPPAGKMMPPRNPKKWRRFLKPLFYAIVGIIVISLAWSALVSGTTWRAIFLTNNQVYFGHFWNVPFASTITLRDVYYLQVDQPSEQLTDQTQAQSQLKLVKLGNEIHGPTDEMTIPMSQVLFWETLRPDSAIVKTIQNGQSQ